MKKLINWFKKTKTPDSTIRLVENQTAKIHKSKTFARGATCKVTKHCHIKYWKITKEKLYFKVFNPNVATEIDADTGDIVYFDRKEFDKLKYKYV